MSEIVQKHMETMTEEFENMSRTKLFTTEESRKVMKKRKEFEYKINGVHKNLQDFKDYILYEEMILKTIKLRRDKLKIGEKKSNLEQKMASRIKTLYQTAIRRFSNDLDLYLQFFKFCKQVNYVHAASSVVRILLEHFAQTPETWQIASRWYAYDRRDVEKGLRILYKGIALHKDNKLLYTDVIKLEILKVEQKRSAKEETPTNLLEELEKKCSVKIQAYVKEAINNIDDYKYFVGLLAYLEDYKFTLFARKLIYNYLLKNYGHEEDVKQILEQKNYGDEEEVEMKQSPEEPEASTSSKN